LCTGHMDLNFTQRWRRNDMSEERRNLLDEIGFVWNAEEFRGTAAGARNASGDESWSLMYSKLKAYKQKYGDCLVTRNFKDDMKLGRWVSRQVSHKSIEVWRKPDERKSN